MRPPDSPGSKKGEFKVPDANFKRARRESEIPDDVSLKKTHIRSSASITSLKQIHQKPASSASPASQKPTSVRGHKPNSSISMKNPAPSESEVDDGASVADSILTSRVRRTEAERIEYFNNQPEASNVEPHSIVCLRCRRQISLGKRQTYAVKPWEAHRSRCDAKVPAEMFNDSPQKEEGSEAGITVRTHRSEAERKAILEADTRALDVQPDQVLCKRCKKWIRLGGKTARYALKNWETHQQRCSGVMPSSKVATAERKLRLVNDPRARAFGPRHVECGTCRKSIILEGEADYTLACWDQHKAECAEAAQDKATSSKSPSENSATSGSSTVIFSPQAQARPPPSVESSSTVVSPEATEGSPQKAGKKRRLEEADLEPEDAEAPPANRPRTETYVPVEKEAPSVMGWFLMPLKSFIRGFKESIS
ncbi:hypothetical protein VNI00_000800 [Paramarasmius palmivorus]|uniref:Uncharacterized protein n=1 Tax=Paramarasmius palmivorus TaxID=297713 RepID=A0AAW0E9M3_9AGAR